MKKIVICGDSFNRGIGCRDLANEPYGSILAKELDLELVNLAKGSATHLNIFLQAKYALEKWGTDIALLCASVTSYDRIDWFPLDHQQQGELSLTDVNYHQYPPYGENSYIYSIPSPLADDPQYRGVMLTENLHGVMHYWEEWGSKNKNFNYFDRINSEPRERMRTLYDYARMVHDPHINRLHSIGLMTMIHNMSVTAKVPHLILTHEVLAYSQYINEKNLVEVDWGRLSREYPDDLPSGHTSWRGHQIVAETLKNKILSEKLL